MKRNEFVKAILGMSAVTSLSGLQSLAGALPVQGKKMPVLFTSHGSPMDIVRSREERPFWNALYELGKQLRSKYEIKAALVVSAHWCTKGAIYFYEAAAGLPGFSENSFIIGNQ